MPANRLSLQLTKAYQQRLNVSREQVQRLASESWPSIEAFDGSDWSQRMARTVAQAQTQTIRTTAGYLSAFLTLELGKRTTGPAIDSRSYIGKSFDGASLAKGLESPLIGVRARLAQGSSAAEALRYGLDRAKRQVGMDLDRAHRQALLDAIHNDDRFDGWQRATSGTCGACLSVAAHVSHGLWFPVHPGCQCVSEPVVAGLPNTFARATGAELFAAKSEDEQNEAVGPLAAQMLREGRIQLSDLVEHEELNSTDHGFITQKPVDRLVATNPTA
jgi:hypothetical protein